MSLLTPQLTDDGMAMIVAAMNGDSITFTKAVIGNTTIMPAHPEQLTDVVSPMVTAEFTAISEGSNYVALAAVFTNLEIESGAYASELGLYAKDSSEEEYLYAYVYVGENADYVPAASTGRTVTNHMTIVVAIGNAEEVDAVLIDASAYATREDLTAHINDHNNPHMVDKEDVGLEKVENEYFVDNLIAIDKLTSATNLATGDTLRQALSKIYYWIQKIITEDLGFIPTSGYGDIWGATPDQKAGIQDSLWFSDSGKNVRGIGGRMSLNDFWRVVGAGSKAVNPLGTEDGVDCGYLEIATADNGTEPIVVRQYSYDAASGGYKFSDVKRTMYLLDHNGDTVIPGNLWMEKPWSTDGNYDKLIGGHQSLNDYVVIRFGANSALNPQTTAAGTAFLEFAVGDDGQTTMAEPIIATQYYGNHDIKKGFGTVGRRAYILNGAGNTVFPGSCTAKSHPTSSDLKKKDVHGNVDLETAEKLVMGLQPIFYNFKGQWKESAGFGAQDVYKLTQEIGLEDNGLYRATKMPESEEIAEGVEYHDADIEAHDDADIEWNLNYTEFIPYLVKVIQDQQKRLADQEKRIEALEEEIKCLQ
jgi:hypothetical protein